MKTLEINYRKTVFFILFCVFCDCSFSEEMSYELVEIYYYDWDVLHRKALSVEDVRSVFSSKITIKHHREIEKFVDSLFSLKFERKVNYSDDVDVRLVIDLFDEEGKRNTYYSSKFYLYSADGKGGYKIDEFFREKFRVRLFEDERVPRELN